MTPSPTAFPPSRIERLLGSAGTIIVFAAAAMFLYGGLGSESGPPSIQGWAALALGFLLLAYAARRGWRPAERDLFIASALALAIVFVSPVSHRLFFFLSSIELHATWPYFLLVGLGLWRWLRVAPDRRARWLFLAAQVALAAAFLDYTRGSLITRDDHPSFLYRFYLAREMFPRAVFYNPEWNGGYLATELITTGALSPFLLALPFAVLGSVERVYACAVPYFFVGLLPWLFSRALRRLGVNRAGAALGGILALCPITVLFLYSLLYGVYPFVISCTLAVLAAALFARMFLDGEPSPSRLLALVGATSLCLFWPLGALMLFPLIPAFFLVARRLDRRGWLYAVATVVILTAVNLPWIYKLATFGDSARFVVEQRSRVTAAGVQWAEAVRAFWHMIEQLHPLSAVLAPVGLVLLARRGVRARWRTMLLGALLLWNLLVAVFGVQVKEHVALERFALSFALFAAVGAAAALGRLVEGSHELWRGAVAAVTLAVLLMGIIVAAQHYRNQGRYRYQLLPSEIQRSITAVRESCAGDRRVLVPGFSLHWFGGGHVAALPFLTKRSFVGNDFYHRRDYNDAVPPRYQRPESLREFLDLYNVGCVLTWNEPWAQRLTAFPGASLVHDEGSIKLFSVPGGGGYFLRGEGRVTERVGRLVVQSADEDVVIKYRFTKGLRTIPPVPIEPFPVYGDVSFIRLHPGGARRVEIVHG